MLSPMAKKCPYCLLGAPSQAEEESTGTITPPEEKSPPPGKAGMMWTADYGRPQVLLLVRAAITPILQNGINHIETGVMYGFLEIM